jgi:CRISPR-associated protein Cmr3
MLIEIEANDTLFFRDGKPFTMGEDVLASGNFPPSPSVIYGALRAIYFGNNIEELSKAQKENDPTKNLKIKSIYYKFDNTFYLKAPLDIVESKTKQDDFSFLKLKENKPEYFSSSNLDYILYSDTEVESCEDLLVSFISFNQQFVKGDRSKITKEGCKKVSNLLSPEPKVGIGRDKQTNTTKEGYLYRVGMIRSKDLKIVVEFEGLDIPDKGIVRLGGEGKTAYYNKLTDGKNVVEPYKPESLRFALYLSTPAIFKNGWLPEWIKKEENFTVNKDDINIKFLTAVIGKVQYIGGFDMVNNCPKPMKRAVPAGSVYYFKAESKEDFDKAISIFHGKSISDELPEQGFGISYIGGLK